jgi:hypothetical protein
MGPYIYSPLSLPSGGSFGAVGHVDSYEAFRHMIVTAVVSVPPEMLRDWAERGCRLDVCPSARGTRMKLH